MHVPSNDSVSAQSSSVQHRLGAAVKACRARLGITQEELAWRADMHRSYIADIERGGRNLTLRNIIGLAKALQIPAERLLAPSRAAGGKNRLSLGEILLVEDNAADAELVLRSFTRADVANPVRVAVDGEEALDYVFRRGRFAKLKSAIPQLILLDLNLPKISGLEVLHQLKADERAKDIPVVVLTSSRNDATIIECGQLGVENYILKPVNIESLRKVTPKLKFRWGLLQPADARDAAGD